MTAPSAEEREALARLAARPEGRVVLEYLQQAMLNVGKRLVQERDPVALRIWQGQAQVLDVLLQAWKP